MKRLAEEGTHPGGFLETEDTALGIGRCMIWTTLDDVLCWGMRDNIVVASCISSSSLNSTCKRALPISAEFMRSVSQFWAGSIVEGMSLFGTVSDGVEEVTSKR